MSVHKAECPTDPRRVWWDEKDCERMNRHEFEAVRCLLGAVSYIAHASEDLQKRLECIPGGRQRMAMAKGAVNAIANDLIGTMTAAQCKQMQNVMKDMEMRIVRGQRGRNQRVPALSDAGGGCAAEGLRRRAALPLRIGRMGGLNGVLYGRGAQLPTVRKAVSHDYTGVGLQEKHKVFLFLDVPEGIRKTAPRQETGKENFFERMGIKPKKEERT